MVKTQMLDPEGPTPPAPREQSKTPAKPSTVKSEPVRAKSVETGRVRFNTLFFRFQFFFSRKNSSKKVFLSKLFCFF